jgi:hypothetical protein
MKQWLCAGGPDSPPAQPEGRVFLSYRSEQPGGVVLLLNGEWLHAGCGEAHPIARHTVLHCLLGVHEGS